MIIDQILIKIKNGIIDIEKEEGIRQRVPEIKTEQNKLQEKKPKGKCAC